MLTLFRCLLRLYPASWRHDFGDEMTSTFERAQNSLSPGLAARFRFYWREFSGLLAGALRARAGRIDADTPVLSGDIRPHPEFRFARAAQVMMLMTFAGVVLAIAKASVVAGDSSGSAWRTLAGVFALMLALACAAAGLVWGILHCMRRTGLHRLENTSSYSVAARNDR